MISPVRQLSPFYRQLAAEVAKYGGYFNAHTHMDRAGTMDEKYWQTAGLRVEDNSAISLHEKHHLIHEVHRGPAYDVEDLQSRVAAHLAVMTELGTRRVDTLADCTLDRVRLTALETLLALKAEWADRIEMKVAAYTPLGFPVAEPERWELFLEAADRADFLSALPESDDLEDYPDNIGFEEHTRRMLKLAAEQGKMIHMHTDQRNEPTEDGTERVLRVMREEGHGKRGGDEPWVWMIHMVSPSTYDEARFERLTQDLLDLGCGVICCPSAAVGMRQLRSAVTPTYNSIPRVLELVAAGVPVRLGSDNIADMCSPSTTADLGDEVFTLSAAIRYYQPELLACLAAGTAPTDAMRRTVREHLLDNDKQIKKVLTPIDKKRWTSFASLSQG
jgi:cytosine/creatinine deaminase